MDCHATDATDVKSAGRYARRACAIAAKSKNSAAASQRPSGGAVRPHPAADDRPAPKRPSKLGTRLPRLRCKTKDGSFGSLQGHGEDVLLQSDSPQPACCLPAFSSGAGYDHRQHQYRAAVVAKGFDFIVKNQQNPTAISRPSRSAQDQKWRCIPTDRRNSRYAKPTGMTQDARVDKESRPSCHRITIEATQSHRPVAEWRYSRPQVSSD